MNVQSPPREVQPDHTIPISTLNASPPIQVWIPNQPHATTERRRDGMCAPTVPNDARA